MSQREGNRGGLSAGGDNLTNFAERLLAVIDEGRKTATYKLATLLAIIDSCAEGASPSGEAPHEIRTRDLAHHVARLYWPQLRPFAPPPGVIAKAPEVDLRQITNKSATIIEVLRRVSRSLPFVATWDKATEVLAAGRVQEVLDKVEHTVARYPLVRLQTVDNVPQPFIYDIDWDETVTRARLAASGGARIRLRPGAGDHLVRLAPLVRPLVELHWVRMVARLNDLSLVEEDLHRHLFGAERVPFPTGLRSDLLGIQGGACFYCRERVTSSPAVDHFVPWSRWPNDAVENLVIAHSSCNGHKSDHVAGPVPLGRWVRRLSEQADDLTGIATTSGWRTDRPGTVALARSLYAHLPDGALVWNAPRDISVALRSEMLRLLEPL
ncbi:MAG: HNH endonuclease [Actinomycetota bacterium]|nr:HNH endonuclease [Actinomycetota bacterium]